MFHFGGIAPEAADPRTSCEEFEKREQEDPFWSREIVTAPKRGGFSGLPDLPVAAKRNHLCSAFLLFKWGSRVEIIFCFCVVLVSAFK